MAKSKKAGASSLKKKTEITLDKKFQKITLPNINNKKVEIIAKKMEKLNKNFENLIKECENVLVQLATTTSSTK